MEYTQNYKLKKPGQEDFYNVDDFNSNADIIDQKLKEIEDKTKNIVTSVNGKTGNVELTAEDVGAETPAGAQAKADAALASAKDYTDQQISAITPEQIGAETPTGAQAKAAAAEANAKNYADETKVSKAGDTITGILTMDGGNAINFGGKFQIAYNSATNSLDITVVG